MSLSTTTQSAFRTSYDLAFQVSPIILNGGIFANTLGKMMPIIGLLGQLGAFTQGALSTSKLSADDFFAKFIPIPGSTIINNAVGTYPFANTQVAANAIITQPKNISLEMIAPVKDVGGYLTKLAVFESLRASLDAHCAAGGTFHIATPAHIYTNCLLTAMTDVTTGESRQQQIQWQLDFVQPLVTQQQATAAYNATMGKLTSGQKITQPKTPSESFWSSVEAAIGAAAQGAVQSTTGMSAVVNTFISSAQ
jgi:hypothetical protein